VGQDVEQFRCRLGNVGGKLQLVCAGADEAEEEGGADDSGGGPAAENHDGEGEEAAAFTHVFNELLAANCRQICAGQSGARSAEEYSVKPSTRHRHAGGVGGLGRFANGDQFQTGTRSAQKNPYGDGEDEGEDG